MGINTNPPAQSGARLLSESSALLSKSLNRLSSGSKLVSPEGDAASMAVSMRFDSQIARTNAARSNLSNAISFSQTQEGFLQKIGKALTRMSELTMLPAPIKRVISEFLCLSSRAGLERASFSEATSWSR